MNTPSNESSSLACDLTAIPWEAREEHWNTAPQIFALAQEVQELSDGYAIRLLNEPDKFMAIARFIEKERLCCSFFHFGLEVELNNGPLWLQVTGGEGVKEILQTSLFGSIVDRVALKQLIQTGATAIIMKHYPNH